MVKIDIDGEKMKEIVINDGKDILHLELIEALGLLTAETVSNGYEIGEMKLDPINTNLGEFKYTLLCEKVTDDVSLLDKIKRWFK